MPRILSLLIMQHVFNRALIVLCILSLALTLPATSRASLDPGNTEDIHVLVHTCGPALGALNHDNECLVETASPRVESDNSTFSTHVHSTTTFITPSVVVFPITLPAQPHPSQPAGFNRAPPTARGSVRVDYERMLSAPGEAYVQSLVRGGFCESPPGMSVCLCVCVSVCLCAYVYVYLCVHAHANHSPLDSPLHSTPSLIPSLPPHYQCWLCCPWRNVSHTAWRRTTTPAAPCRH